MQYLLQNICSLRVHSKQSLKILHNPSAIKPLIFRKRAFLIPFVIPFSPSLLTKKPNIPLKYKTRQFVSKLALVN